MEITSKDAEDIGSVLKDAAWGGNPPEKVTILTENDATKENFINALNNIIEAAGKIEEATVFIYYSGHGGVYTSSITGKPEHYLLTHGYDTRQPDNTMVSASLFSKMIENLRGQRLLVLLDCCHAAGMKIRGNDLVQKGDMVQTRKSITGIEFIKQLASGRGRVFVSSCAAHEQSVILPGANNSLFTEVALEALKGKASGTAPFVRVIDLLYLLLCEVPERIKPYRHSQNPVINEVENLNSSYILCMNQSYPDEISTPGALEKTGPMKEEQKTADEKILFIRKYSQKINNHGEVINQVNIDTNHAPINL